MVCDPGFGAGLARNRNLAHDVGVTGAVIDAWMQHPSLRLLNHEMLESLRRWTGMGGGFEVPMPLETTIESMDEAGVELGLSAVWYGPEGPLIENDEVAQAVARYPLRLKAVASVDL